MIRRICKCIVFKILYPMVYNMGRLRRVNAKKILFIENHSDDMSSDYQLLYDELEQQGYDLTVHYLKMSSASWGEIIRRTVSMVWDITTASIVFLNESNSVFGSFTMKKDTKLIQLWHACGAFKKWGFSVADKSFGDDRKNLEEYSGHRNYDLVPVSGDAVCWAYEEAFGLQDKSDVVKAMGVSRTDVYFSEERKWKAFEKLRHFIEVKQIGNTKELDNGNQVATRLTNRKIILYAPTFRGDIRGAKSPDKLDLTMLSQLADDYIILVKQHPFVKEQFYIPEECKSFCTEVGTEISVEQLTTEELLMVSDICITDYSSIVFEYSLMKKPMFFFAYDLEQYYDERGFYYPYEDFVPGPIVRSTEELLQQLQGIEAYDMSKVEAFCNQYMSACDGHSTKRILDYAITGK